MYYEKSLWFQESKNITKCIDHISHLYVVPLYKVYNETMCVLGEENYWIKNL